MLKKILKLFVWLILICQASILYSYDIPTHQDLTNVSVERSILNQEETMFKLGFRKKPIVEQPSEYLNQNNELKVLYRDQNLDPRTLQTLIVYGAALEDNHPSKLAIVADTATEWLQPIFDIDWVWDDFRPGNHFYDPQTNLPFETDGFTFLKSPDWILEDNFEVTSSQYTDGQIYSYKDAKEYLYKSFFFINYQDKLKQQSLFFETLGHIVHHLQDMSQPQHTRGDQHGVPGDNGYEENAVRQYYYIDPQDSDSTPVTAHKKSLSDLPIYPNVSLNTPRNYWGDINNTKGIAWFSSTNFVSSDTNFNIDYFPEYTILPEVNHPLPIPGDTVLISVDDPRISGPNTNATGFLNFVTTELNDYYTNDLGQINDMASTSIFGSDYDIVGSDSFDWFGVVLHRINFDQHLNYLLPRAMGYSSGMIDFLLRGEIDIKPTVNGIYGIVDHATNSTLGPDTGFSKLKMRIKNITPDITYPDGTVIPQGIGIGELEAIVKYSVNDCYEENLTGELQASTGAIPSGCSVSTYEISRYDRTKERISISQPKQLLNIPSDDYINIEFDFSGNLIPMNAKNIYIQLVYRGTLGDESDAIVVSTRKISEPTYLTVENNTDYYYLNNAEPYTESEILSDPALLSVVDIDGDGVPDSDISPKTINMKLGFVDFEFNSVIPPASFSRFAVLAETSIVSGNEYPLISFVNTNASEQTFALELHPFSNSRDVVTDVHKRVFDFDMSRGVPRYWIIKHLQGVDGLIGFNATPESFELMAPISDIPVVITSGIPW